MVTGCAAFTGDTTSDLIAAVLEREPVPCVEHIKIMPAELQRIISKALMKKADERYQTVAEMATDLQRLERQFKSGDEIPTVSDKRDSATNDKYALPERSLGLQRFLYVTARASAFALMLAAVATLGYALFFRSSSVGNQSEIKSLAVLPFKSFAREADDHLGIGIADTIIGKVSRIDGMIVRPTSAVQKYAANEMNSIEAAKQLGVDAVLDGTLQRAGDRLRVSANLLRTSDGVSLWT